MQKEIYLYKVMSMLLVALLVWYPLGFPRTAHARHVVTVFLTSGTSWTIPTGFTTPWSIEVIGGGGGSSNAQGVGGGAGAAYAKITDADRSLSAGGVLYYSIGAGGASAAGGDTWANGTANSAPTLVSEGALAKGGGTNSTQTGGTGGASASSVGSTKSAGGNGGLGNASDGSGGGGGAAGPSGDGKAGGSAGFTGGFEGGGGGGSNGGSSSVGGASDATTGGVGGNGTDGTGGGSGATSVAAAGAGTVGGGGGGGYLGTFVGAVGGTSIVWTNNFGVTSGSGGGGGGGGDGDFAGATGGAGALYGGGGGGDGTSGANGIVVITYATTEASHLTFSGNVKFAGDLRISGALSKSSGTFAIDHPLDPANKILFHSFVESPEAKNLYDGIAVFNKDGRAIIKLPSYFGALNGKFRYQFFPLDQSMPNLYIKDEVKNNQFSIAGGVPGGRVSWQVTGVRHDPYILLHPIINTVKKGPGTIVKKGECIFAPLCK